MKLFANYLLMGRCRTALCGPLSTTPAIVAIGPFQNTFWGTIVPLVAPTIKELVWRISFCGGAVVPAGPGTVES